MADRGVSAHDALTLGAPWFTGALGLYWLSGARGLVWADSSKLTLYALAGYVPSLNPGDHAGWTAICWVWFHLLGGDPVLAAHRLSAVAGALVVALGALLVLERSGDRARAHSAAALLLVALPLWWSAGVAETYAPALAATLAGALVLRQGVSGWRWWAAGGLWGLALATHAMAVFLVVPLAWEVGRTRAWRLLPGVLVGSAPVWLALFGGPRDPLTGFAAGGPGAWRWHWEAFLAFARAPRNAALLGALLAYGLGVFGLLAFWRARREPRGHAVWAWSLGALSLLLLSYAPFRLHLMVAFLMVGLVLALPVQLSLWARVGHIGVQSVAYVVVPAVLTLADHQALGVRVIASRNNAFYFLCPVKTSADRLPGRESAAEESRNSDRLTTLRRWAGALDPGTTSYLATVARCAPADAVVLSDFNPGAVLRLAQVAHAWRPDLTIRPVAVDVALGTTDPTGALAAEIERTRASRPVLLADSYPPYYRSGELAARFELRPCGSVIAIAGGPPEGRRGRERADP